MQWGELHRKDSNILLEIYPNPDGDYWSFEFNDVLQILNQAKLQLIGERKETA